MCVGCVHRPGISPAEQCAAQGMLLGGMSMSSATSRGVAVSGEYVAVARGDAYSEAVSCVRPSTVDEQCEVEGERASLGKKAEFSPTGYNIALGIGYLLYILPGLVIYVFVHDADEGAAIDARQAGYAARNSCLARAQPVRLAPPIRVVPAPPDVPRHDEGLERPE